MLSYYSTIIQLEIKKVVHFFLKLICIPILKLNKFKNYRTHLLRTWNYLNERNLIDKILYYPFFILWTNKIYLKEKNPVRREHLKEQCMGSSTGANWAKYYDQNPISDSDVESSLFYSKINEICTLIDELLVIQIGCSSGREIYYYAKKYPRHIFIGTDIYQKVIEYASDNHKLPNLRYTKSFAHEIQNLITNCMSKNILIISSGSLQYVQPEHITLFFTSLASCNCMIVLHEPANTLRGAPDQIEGSLYRENFSYTHNYKFYSEKAGFNTDECDIKNPFTEKSVESLLRRGTVHYFWHGRSPNCSFKL